MLRPRLPPVHAVRACHIPCRIPCRVLRTVAVPASRLDDDTPLDSPGQVADKVGLNPALFSDAAVVALFSLDTIYYMGSSSKNHSFSSEWPVRASFYVLLIVILVLAFSSLSWPLLLDMPYFHYVAFLIDHGYVPYRDIYDINGPGTFLHHYLILKVFGSSDFGFRLYSIILTVVTSYLLYLVVTSPTVGYPSKESTSNYVFTCKPSRQAGIAAFLVLLAVTLSYGFSFAVERDYSIMPLILGALYLEYCIGDRGYNQSIKTLLIGSLIGLAASIKLHSLLLIPILAFFSDGNTLLKFRRMILLCLGGVISWMPFFAYLYLNHSIPAFIFVTTKLIPLYSSCEAMGVFIMILLFSIFSIIVLSFLYLLFISENIDLAVTASKVRSCPNYQALLIGLVYGAFHFIVQNKGFDYHLYPFIVFVIGLMSLIFFDIGGGGDRLTYHLCWWCFIGCFISFPLQYYYRLNLGAYERTYTDVRDYILRNSEKHDKILVLGQSDAFQRAQLSTGRLLATKHPNDVFLLYFPEDPTVKELRKEFMADLRDSKPKLILIPDNSWWNRTKCSNFPEFMSYLDEAYTLDRNFTNAGFFGYNGYLLKGNH